MKQINFRLQDEESNALQILAEESGMTMAEFAKRKILQDIKPLRVELAFKYLGEGKIGKKKAWFLSGLNYYEFMNEWTKRNAEEMIDDKLEEKGLQVALELDDKELRKKSNSSTTKD
jgi:hypothetical protein